MKADLADHVMQLQEKSESLLSAHALEKYFLKTQIVNLYYYRTSHHCIVSPVYKTLSAGQTLTIFSSALIVCVYEEPVVPEQAATVTEKLGEYLISVGY